MSIEQIGEARSETPTLYADYIQIVGSHQRYVDGKLPIWMDGFAWATLVPRRLRRIAVGDEAVAVQAHSVVGRGTVSSIVEDGTEMAVHVVPHAQ